MYIKQRSRCALAGFIPIIALLLTLTHCNEQTKVTLMTYNAGNLFDDRVDGTEYSPYGSGPAGGWTSGKFEAKLAAVARVIKSAFPGGPDILALQEVENLNALNQLCDRYLQEMHYTYRFMYPVTGLAHQCALLSRYPFKQTGALVPGDWHGAPQRVILEAELTIQGQPLHVFVNHWKSKNEGEKATEPGRLKSAEQLVTRLKSLLTTNPLADVLILGDFNEDTDEFVKAKGKYQTAFMPADTQVELPASLTAEGLAQSTILLTGQPTASTPASANITLYDPWYEMAGQARGSYVFRGQWFTLDHILLTVGLFDGAGFQYQPKQFNAMRAEFLLDPQTGFPLKESMHANGFSDHLPLLMTLLVSSTTK